MPRSACGDIRARNGAAFTSTRSRVLDELSGRQRRYLRGLGNRQPATVYLGRDGLTGAMLGSLEEAFHNSELVKVRIERTCPIARKEAGPQLASAATAHLVQILGQTVLLYRPDPDEPTIELPE